MLCLVLPQANLKMNSIVELTRVLFWTVLKVCAYSSYLSSDGPNSKKCWFFFFSLYTAVWAQWIPNRHEWEQRIDGVASVSVKPVAGGWSSLGSRVSPGTWHMAESASGSSIWGRPRGLHPRSPARVYSILTYIWARQRIRDQIYIRKKGLSEILFTILDTLTSLGFLQDFVSSSAHKAG